MIGNFSAVVNIRTLKKLWFFSKLNVRTVKKIIILIRLNIMGIILFTVYTQGISFLYVQVQFLFFMHPDQAVQAVWHYWRSGSDRITPAGTTAFLLSCVFSFRYQYYVTLQLNWVVLSFVFNFKADKQYYVTFVTDCRLQVVWECSDQFICDLGTVVCTCFF